MEYINKKRKADNEGETIETNKILEKIRNIEYILNNKIEQMKKINISDLYYIEELEKYNKLNKEIKSLEFQLQNLELFFTFYTNQMKKKYKNN